MKIILNFKDADTFRKLERKAYDGTIEVADFPPAEYRYFSELIKLYYAFKHEGLSKEEASRKKAILLRQYNEALAEHERCLEVYRKYQEHIRIAGLNLSKIEKSTDASEIALLACESLGAMMGESTFYGRQKRKVLND